VTDLYKRNADLAAELKAARRRIAELESEEARRRRAEEVMRKNAEFLRGILDTTAAGLIVADREGTIVFANPRAEELAGRSVNDLAGRSCLASEWDLRDANGRPIPPEKDLFFRVRDTGKSVAEHAILTLGPDGIPRHHLVNAAPLKNQDGSVSHVVFADYDITDLRRLQEAHRVLIENSRQGFSLFQDNRVVYANPALAEMLGCRVDEMIGLSVVETIETFFHPEDREMSMEAYTAAINGEFPIQPLAYRAVRRDGGVRHFESYVSLTQFEGRPAVQIVSIDVTERKEAERALEDSRRNLQEFFNCVEDFVFVLSLDGQILKVNTAIIERMGYPEDQLIGSSFAMLHPSERRREVQKLFEEVLAGDRAPGESTLQTASGELIPVETRLNFGLWNGEPALYGVSRDISKRLAAEQKIREGERRFTEALEAARHVLYRFNMRENRYDYVSPHVEEFNGYSYEEFINRGLGDFAKEIHPGDFLRLQAAMREAVENAKGHTANLTVELRLRFKDGAYHWVSDSMMLVLDDHGSVEAVVGSVHDIERRKRAEVELQRKNQHLEKVLQAAPVILLAADLNGICTFFEGRGLEGFAIDPQKVVGKHVFEFLGGPPGMRAWLERALAGEEFSIEQRFEPAGRTFVGHTAQLLDAEGNREGTVVVHIDITEQKKAQEAMERAHTMFLNFADNFPGVMSIRDEESRLVFANRMMREWFDADNWIGKRADEYMAREVAERSLADDQTALAKGPLVIEEPLVDKQGRTRIMRTWKFPLEAESRQRLLGVISYDITEQRQAENAYQTLVENSLQGLALIRNGKVVFVNARAVAISGYSETELLALTPDKVFALIVPADHALIMDRIQRRQCGEDLPPLFHMRLIRKDGVVRRLLVCTSAIEYDNIPVVQVAFLDVTDFPEAQYGRSR